jgi:hypothetical protein
MWPHSTLVKRQSLTKFLSAGERSEDDGNCWPHDGIGDLEERRRYAHLAFQRLLVHFLPPFFRTDFSGRDPYVPITTNSPLTYAATLFRQGIHRLPVVDEHTKAVRVTPSS